MKSKVLVQTDSQWADGRFFTYMRSWREGDKQVGQILKDGQWYPIVEESGWKLK